MIKLKDLHTYLLNSKLKLPAEHLMVFATEGKITSFSGGTNNAFKSDYTANILITQCAYEVNTIGFLVLQWINENEPYQDESKIDFQVDILNSNSADIHLKIRLSETVNPDVREDGTQLVNQPEPDMDELMANSLGLSLGTDHGG